MIYRLPTNGRTAANAYRGLYPNRLRSISLGRCVHVELNDGARFVMTRADICPDMRNERSYLGVEFMALTGVNRFEVQDMALTDYVGVCIVQRALRKIDRRFADRRRSIIVR